MRYRILILQVLLTVLFVQAIKIYDNYYESESEGLAAVIDEVLSLFILLLQYIWFVPFWALLSLIFYFSKKEEYFHGSLLSLEFSSLLILVVLTPSYF